ncbi:hypothetical protein DEU56DRAFT_873093 [Suillus clintonianus]|uniref:uncharacterized protein n=1 Tax=Suillus clintonianus TaxID=1904413 RepID=UPI001B85E472|nr:uncharacterized protein DEU56DRAFT_873093 [Suillus clintonianus]KAG2125464.1 hypothetical protein DEU56DRAFT_873093 [Suillus clintonianus]
MPRGRPPKRPALEREVFVPVSINPEPHLLRLRAAEITAEGSTRLQTHYVAGIPPENSSNDNIFWIDDRVEHPSDCQFEDETLTDDIVDICSTEKRKETAADQTLLAWIGQTSNLLDEMLRLNGRGTEGVTCSCGGSIRPQRPMRDCHGIQIFCRECTLQNHVLHPLHRIEVYGMGLFFSVSHSNSSGFGYKLGHNPGERCYKPSPAAGDDFVVIALDGIHEIALDFCGCASAQIRYKQLLRMRWYPATHFHILSFESKVSAYEFYQSLARHTDNSGLVAIRDRYSAFMRMVRQWRNLKQLSRGGRGHDPAGVNATAEGELAVLCPACPQPGKNLPLDWEKEPLFTRWKYALFVAIDANFRLKRKAVSSDTADPSLNAGWAYFVHEDSYKSYLADRASDKQERSTCVSHNAVNMADTKSSRGLAATGVGTIDCARHDMKLPNGVGDLQKGERYINMDYIMCSALFILAMSMINISYDIACQWHKRLWTRMETMPERLSPPRESSLIRVFVPKFHIQAHIDKCRTNFSFNWSRYVGRTDGEAPERGWSNINRVASSTKEMGPGARRDTLDDHFGDWNWKKITALDLGRTLHKKMIEAVKWTKEHSEALSELEKTIQPALIAQWKAEVESWEEDNSSPNPFESRFNPVTQASVRLQLTELEAQDLQAGINVSLHTDVSPSGLITSGMDLEDQHGRPQELKPEDFNLWLPSQLPAGTPVDLTLAGHEWELRYAQALDALNEVRSHLRLRSHMYKYKDKNVRGQAGSTRAKKIIDAVESRKHASVLKYRRARSALLSLGHRLEKCGWELTMRPLLDSDVKPMGDMEQQGRGTISWIWLDSRADNSCTENEHIQDCVRLEWCKARARAHRWSEEVELLLEEMRRVLVFLRWQGSWWKERVTLRTLNSAPAQEGLSAYACRQSALRVLLIAKFQRLWSDVPTLVSGGVLIPESGEVDTPTIDAPLQL